MDLHYHIPSPFKEIPLLGLIKYNQASHHFTIAKGNEIKVLDLDSTDPFTRGMPHGVMLKLEI